MSTAEIFLLSLLVVTAAGLYAVSRRVQHAKTVGGDHIQPVVVVSHPSVGCYMTVCQVDGKFAYYSWFESGDSHGGCPSIIRGAFELETIELVNPSHLPARRRRIAAGLDAQQAAEKEENVQSTKGYE
jgi:hypothetical protein